MMGTCSSPSPPMTPKNRMRSFGVDRRPDAPPAAKHVERWRSKGNVQKVKRYETSPSPIINNTSAARSRSALDRISHSAEII